MPNIWEPWPGNTKTVLPAVADATNDRAAQVIAGELVQPGQQSVAVAADDDGPLLEGRPARQRPPHVGDVQVRVGAQVGRQPRGLRVQRRQRFRRDRPRHHRCLRTVHDARRLGRHRLDDDVRVGAADAEGRHTRPARTVAGPRPRLGQQRHRTGRPVDVRAGFVDMQCRGQHLVAHRQDHLDHAGHPGGGLRVTHVRLDRTQPQRLAAILPVGRQQGLRLDRVTQCGSGAVAFDDVHLRRRQSGAGQRGTHHPLLRGTVGRGQPVGGAVLIDRRAAHHGQHRMPQALRVGQALHHEHAAALGESGAVGRAGVGLAPAVLGQPAHAAELHEDVGRGVDGDAAGQGQVALARAQRLRGHVQRHQRRRTRRVHRHRRALQAQHIGHPARRHTRGLAGQPEALRSRCGAHAVTLRVHPGEHSGGAAAQACRAQFPPAPTLPRTARGTCAAAGSMDSASLGAMPKKAGSKSATPSTKPPVRV